MPEEEDEIKRYNIDLFREKNRVQIII